MCSAAFVCSATRTTLTCYNLHWTVQMLIAHDGPAVIDQIAYSSRIAIFATPCYASAALVVMRCPPSVCMSVFANI